jgi:hypothetical protein
MAISEHTITVKVNLDEEDMYNQIAQFLRDLAGDMESDGVRYDEEYEPVTFRDGVAFAADWLRAVAGGRDEL